MLFKNEWIAWSALAGMAGFLLIGNLMHYTQLKEGMWRLLGLVAVLLVVAAAVLLILARFNNPKARMKDYAWAFIPVGLASLLIGLMIFLGGA